MNHNTTYHLKLKKKHTNVNQNVEPLLELYKGKLFSSLVKMFINNCIQTFGFYIFSIKKSYIRTITNLLSSWILSLYIDYDFSSDYFFPTNYNDTKSLEYTLKDLCKYDDKIIDADNKIKTVIENLKNNYKNMLNMFSQYASSTHYKNNKSNYKIKKTKILKNKNNSETICFYKFDIVTNIIIKDKRLLNMVNNILLPEKTYDKMVKIYTGPTDKLNDMLWSITFRYQNLGSNNHQLAVLPRIMNEMHNDFNLNFECFASSINCSFPNYCSIYWDLEQHFGSVGSFFNIIPIKGTYGFNPPYQKDIIEKSINKLFSFLDDTTEDLTFIITIPIWDIEGKTIMKEKFNNELQKQNIDYGDFNIIEQIKNSKYFKTMRMIQKEQFTYIDYNFELYKNKTIQNTYVFIISNTDNDYNKLNEYLFV